MEILISFILGFAIAGISASVIWANINKTKISDALQKSKAETELFFKSENSRLQTELAHAEKTASELKASLEEEKAQSLRLVKEAKEDGATLLQTAKNEFAKTLNETKAEYEKRFNSDIQAREKAHNNSMDALQKRFDETLAKISAQVKADTGEMLMARQKEFAEASNLSIGQLVNPLKENIAELRKTMNEGSKEQAALNVQMKERIQNLLEHSEAARKSADELAAAFKHGSKMQGDWGETILEELLSSQGLVEGIHYDTQATIVDAEGRPVRNENGGIMRPDVILHLDPRREVIIDSKVSMTAYVDYVNAETEDDRKTYLKAHVDSIKKHIKELAAKDYSKYIQQPKVSAGYVIMFVPNMGALWSAMNTEPDLWRKAADENVYIVDEQSLYGALKIISMTWTQIIQAQNQEKVFKLANEMIERVGLFVERYQAVGKALNKATEEYNEGYKKLGSKGQSIINTSRKLIEMGAKESGKHPITPFLDDDDILDMIPENSSPGIPE